MASMSQHHDLFVEDKQRVDKMLRMQILVPFPVARAYDYLVPETFDVQVGDYVQVPLGRREVTGVVWGEECDSSVPENKLKAVLFKYDCLPMPKAQRAFIDWVSQYTLSDRGSVLKMALSAPKALNPPKPETWYRKNIPLFQKLSAKRKTVYEAMESNILYRASELAKKASCTPAVIKGMADKDIIQKCMQSPVFPCSIPNLSPADIKLSQAQETAAKAMVLAVKAKEFKPFLLDGVTGSGKTEVYFEAVTEAIKQGQQVLVLLPEISLSAQFLERFRKRFGVEPAVWHSETGEAQRRLTWRGVAEGQTKFVVGARSALFLPYQNLGLIIVDEEHDASYKQEEGVIYHARDMALVRAKFGGFPIALVSATPALETAVNTEQGKYDRLILPSRHGGATLPDMHVIDMRIEKPPRQCFISPTLREAIKKTVESGEQAMLFLNRRGYAPLTLCRNCGFRFQCPSCTAWLIEHRRTGRLHCHHCGYSTKTPDICPECEEEESLTACGPGIERLAEELKMFLPEAKPLILASDLTNSPKAIASAITQITDGDVNVIIGTQIIAKGHHFPELTCVGIVDADLGLSGGDLRAGERTFQLLHQVSGRAGRGLKPGHVYVQTFMPDHRVLQALVANDRDVFLAVEAKEREEAHMPPFGRLASLIVSGPEEGALDYFCRTLAVQAPRYDGVQILGPAPAALAILRGKHRRRFLIKTDKNVSVQKVIQTWLSAIKVPNPIRLKIDIDPQNFM